MYSARQEDRVRVYLMLLALINDLMLEVVGGGRGRFELTTDHA